MSAQSIGIDAALGRIQQIQSYQQQLLDPSASVAPASASPVTAASASGGASAATALGSGTSFATLLAALEENQGGTNTGVDVATATGTTATGTTDALASGSGAPAAVESMVSEADSLIGKPYVWGGGHSGWGSQTGYDCSGFVSAVLHAGGYLSTPQDTQTLAQAPGIQSGPGQYVTIYDRTDAGLGSDHVIINLGGQFYESGGEAGAWGGGGGVEKIATPSASYLASFNRVLHPAGL